VTGREGVPDAAAVGFELGADAYVRARPGYPPPLFDLLADRAGLRPGAAVLDLAAGTGKLTAGLVDRGATVTAVEPVAAMRRRLEDLVPEVTVVDGLAESLPLPSTGFDLVTVAQAFHWFDRPAALREIHRVLRPGGHLAMTWNVWDETVDWIRRLADLGEAAGGRPYDKHTSVDWERTVADAGGFGPIREDWFPNWQGVDADTVVDRVSSTSWVAAMAEGERAVVLGTVRDLLASHPATRDHDRFPFPHATVVITTTSVPG
jgi:SAM-dependent methyltransferase